MINLMLVVCNNVLNGTERYVVDLAKNLNKNEYNVFVATPLKGPLSEILKENNINEIVYNNGKLIYYSLGGLINLYRIIKENKIQIVHANAKFHPCIIGKLARTKLNVEIKHGIFYSGKQLERLSFLRKTYEYIKQYFVDEFIAISENDKDILIKYFKINPRKITVIYLGVDVDEINKKSELLPEKTTNVTDKIFTIGHIGRFTFQKAQEYLLEAFLKVSQKYPHANLVIVGSGENKEGLINYISENNLNNRVIMKDYIKDIYLEMSMFDLHVLTSRFEGTPYVNFEAMALGVPIITSDVGGASNIFKNGYDAVITKVESSEDTYNAIDSVIANDKFRKNLIINAAKTLEKYTVLKMTANTSDFYKSKIFS